MFTLLELRTLWKESTLERILPPQLLYLQTGFALLYVQPKDEDYLDYPEQGAQIHGPHRFCFPVNRSILATWWLY